MIRYPQNKLEVVLELPLPHGQKFTVRKTTSLREEDDKPSSHYSYNYFVVIEVDNARHYYYTP